MYIGSILISKHMGNNKPMKRTLYIFFGLYLLLFITLTLFDPMWNRNGLTIINWSLDKFKAYLKYSFNIIPFKTIIQYITYVDSLHSTNTIVVNLLGNFVCLMPLGFFLPILFKKQNNFKIFLLTTTIFVLLIELTQFITFSGSCDIDDLILNVLGACLMYKILKIESLNNLIKNIFLLEKNKLNIKSLLKISGIFILILIITFSLIKLRERIYLRNLNYHMEQYNYDVEILDETDMCSQALEKFYEDELYEYYFNCIKSNNVYALINGEKYLVKDLLNNNPTNYRITIQRLEAAGLTFFIEEKYKSIELEEKEHVDFNTTIDNEEIIGIRYGNYDISETTTKTKLFLIPKESGQTHLLIKVIDLNTDKKIITYDYLIKVNDNLEVTYEKIK